MRKIFFVFILAAISLVSRAATDSSYIQKAVASAAGSHKYILLNFSGSDWCIPCMKMKKTVFSADAFTKYAAEKLVWINADFPRDKKGQTKQQVKENETLADKYNANGIFPYTLLLNEKGSIIKSWEGFPNLTAEEFIKQVDSAINDDRKPGNGS